MHLEVKIHDKYNFILDPRSCKAIKELGLDAHDGEYNLYLNLPECNLSARIYCADMNTTNPKEYITLPAGGSNNFGLHYNKTKGYRDEELWTRFEKVFYRLAHSKFAGVATVHHQNRVIIAPRSAAFDLVKMITPFFRYGNAKYTRNNCIETPVNLLRVNVDDRRLYVYLWRL